MRTLTREELIELVRKLCSSDFETEEENDAAIELFLDNVPDPEATRLIFSNNGKLTPEEIVEKALSYKPICL